MRWNVVGRDKRMERFSIGIIGARQWKALPIPSLFQPRFLDFLGEVLPAHCFHRNERPAVIATRAARGGYFDHAGGPDEVVHETLRGPRPTPLFRPLRLHLRRVDSEEPDPLGRRKPPFGDEDPKGQGVAIDDPHHLGHVGPRQAAGGGAGCGSANNEGQGEWQNQLHGG